MFSLFVFMGSLIASLILVSINDIKTSKIPNSLIVTLYLIGLLNLIDGRVSYALTLTGLVVLPLLVLAATLITGYKIGGGDIKLISALGVVLGFWMLIEAIFIGMIFCLIFIIKRKEIYLGPFISLGAFVSLIITNFIVK